MITYSMDLLVSLVTFSCNKNNIAAAGHHTSSTDSFFPVRNTYNPLFITLFNALPHFPEDHFRIFCPWIIGSQDNLRAVLQGDFRHLRPLCLITVTTCSHNSNELLIFSLTSVNGGKYIFQGI